MKTFSLRTIALGMGSMSGRIGGILSPQINQLYNSVPWLPPLRGWNRMFDNVLTGHKQVIDSVWRLLGIALLIDCYNTDTS